MGARDNTILTVGVSPQDLVKTKAKDLSTSEDSYIYVSTGGNLKVFRKTESMCPRLHSTTGAKVSLIGIEPAGIIEKEMELSRWND